MHLLMIFFTAFIVGLSGAMMPGPVTAVVADQSMRRGIIAGPLIVLGHGILEVIIVGMLILGLGSFMGKDVVAGTIGLAGGLILLFMGYSMISNALKGNISLITKTDNKKKGNPLFAGIVTTLSNPYWFIWWATIGAGYVIFAMEYGTLGVFFFFTGHIFADLLWFFVLSIIFVTGKKFLTDRIYSGIIVFLGVFLIFFGGYFFTTGVNYLRC